MQIGSLTEIGHVRTRNEDAFLVDAGAGVFAVLDGLGGHPAGDLASEVARAALGRCLTPTAVETAADIGELLLDALQQAQEAVLQEAAGHPERTNMATTVVVAVVRDGTAWTAHVGDSRAYLAVDGDLRQVTRDHHGFGGYLTQAVGLVDGVVPDLTEVALVPGSRLLLCTDGLTNMVDDLQIARVLNEGRDPQATCELLVAAALAAGGIDNVTLVLVDP